MQKRLRKKFAPKFLKQKKESINFRIAKAAQKGVKVHYIAVPKQSEKTSE